jgi:hypothetical protein
VPAVNIDTFFFEVIADAVVSALLAIGRRPREAAAAGIDAISRWTEPLWSPAGGELAWRARTDAALSCGDFEYALERVPDISAMKLLLQQWILEDARAPAPAGRWAIELSTHTRVVGGVALLYSRRVGRTWKLVCSWHRRRGASAWPARLGTGSRTMPSRTMVWRSCSRGASHEQAGSLHSEADRDGVGWRDGQVLRPAAARVSCGPRIWISRFPASTPARLTNDGRRRLRSADYRCP